MVGDEVERKDARGRGDLGPTRLGRDQAVVTRAPRVSGKGARVCGRAGWPYVSRGEVSAVGGENYKN